MSARVVVAPCLTVARPHLREAFRALLGQGAPRDGLTDEALQRVLWLARALPVVLDIVEGLALADTRLSEARFEMLSRPPERGPLALLALRVDDEAEVEVLALPIEALERRAFDAACVRMSFALAVNEARGAPTGDGVDGDTGEMPTVRIQRFSVGG